MKLHRDLQSRQSLDRARVALAAGQFDLALEHVGQALAANPGLPPARLLAARIHLARSQPQRALDSLDQHDTYAPDRRDLCEVAMLRATALVRARQHDLARPLLEKLVHEFPDDVRGHEMLAGLALAQGDDRLAIVHLSELLRLAPASAELRRLLADLLARINPPAAINLLEQTPRPQLDDTLRLRLAGLYQADGRDAKAEQQYADLLAAPAQPREPDEIDPRDDPRVWVRAGSLADQAGADGVARQRLEAGAKLERGREASALEALAIVHLHAGRFAAAGHCFWRMTRRGLEQPRGWAGLVVSALAAARPSLATRAGAMLTPMLDLAAQRRLLSELWVHAAAGHALTQGLADAAPPAASSPSPLRGLLRRSVSVLQSQAEAFARRADLHFHLAQCFTALGENDPAAAAADAAIEINPNYEAAAKLRARLAYIAQRKAQ